MGHDRFGVQRAERCPSVGILLELRNPDIGCSGGRKGNAEPSEGGLAVLPRSARRIAASASLAIASFSHRQAVSDITRIAVLNFANSVFNYNSSTLRATAA
jgi:hypothetical protein